MNNFLLDSKSTSRNKENILKSSLPGIVIVVATLLILTSIGQISLISGASTGHAAQGVTSSNTTCSVTSNGQEEKYIYTYAVNSKNHLQAYAITGASVFQERRWRYQ